MAEATGPAPVGGDQTRAPMIIGVYSAMTGLSILCVAARLYTRFRLIRSPGMDDAVIVLSMCIIFTSFVLLCYTTKFGAGRHTYYLLPEEFMLAAKWNYIGAAFAIVGLAVPKLAIVIFLKRIVGQTRRRSIAVLYFLAVSNIVLAFIVVLVLFLECNPPSASWNPSIPHTCWRPHVVPLFTIFGGGYSAAVDLILSLYPAGIISKLNMSRKRKIAVSSLMGLGVLSCVCAIVRTIELAAYQTTLDHTWTSAAATLWAGGEMNVIVICACVPTFLPLVQQITGQKDYRSKPKPQPTVYHTGSEYPLREGVCSHNSRSQTTIKTGKSKWSQNALHHGGIGRKTDIESHWEPL